MPIIILALVLTAGFIGLDIIKANTASLRHAAAAYDARIFRPGFDRAVADAIQGANTVDTSMSGAYAGPFSNIHVAYPACGAAGAQGPGCTATVDETITWAGNTGTGATDTHLQETVANVNVGNNDSGHPNENMAGGTIVLKMIGTRGNTIAMRTATFKLRLTNTPPQFASLESFEDAAGRTTGVAGDGQSSGRCPTSDATCAASGMDSTQANATADDSRFATAHVCYDPSYVGNGGTNPADKCHPTGDPAAAPHYDNSFGSKSLNGNQSSTGWTH